MKILIPMAGSGERFAKKGYSMPKPLIKIEGKPMIRHVVEMFSPQDEFVFICNKRHLENTNMREVLQNCAPKAEIIGIEKHTLGPVYTCTFAFNSVSDDEPVIVNYCDFSVYWDYRDFKKKMEKTKCDGCITAYKGFHPHSLGNTMYAYLKLDEGGKVADIREKEPFTQSRMEEFASAGTYYFSRGEYVKKYFRQQLERKIQKNGEYYASLAYKLMIDDGLKVIPYSLEYFLQWGTPEDLEDYLSWSDYFLRYGCKPQNRRTFSQTNLMPAAGAGMRFAREGYEAPKPLIDVAGKPMIVASAESFPKPQKWVFVCRGEHLQEHGLTELLQKHFQKCGIIRTEKLTAGQASSCLLAKKEVQQDSPLLICPCDSKIILDEEKYSAIASSAEIDALIFTFKGSQAVERNPNMYGWVKIDAGGKALWVSCKKPISENPKEDHAIIGAFYFKKAADFFAAAEEMIRKKRTINGEYYADEAMNELIEGGKKVSVFQVKQCVSFGTPNELKTYLYWRDYFSKRLLRER